MYASILQVISTCKSLYPFPSIVNNYCTSFNLFYVCFSWRASLARFNQSVYVCENKKKDSRWEYLPKFKTKGILLELSRTWWYKSNEYSLLLIISFPTAKENLLRPVTLRHITTGILSAIKMTKESLKYCLCIASNALTNAKILNYKTANFLVRKKSKVLIFILLLQRFKEELSPH